MGCVYGGGQAEVPNRPASAGVRVSLSRLSRLSGSHKCRFHLGFSPNPPMDTYGRRENSGRGVRELRGRWPGLYWGRWETGEGLQSSHGGHMAACGRWAGQDGRERTQQETLADRDGASWRGRWVGRLMGQWRTGGVRPGVESLAAERGHG